MSERETDDIKEKDDIRELINKEWNRSIRHNVWDCRVSTLYGYPSHTSISDDVIVEILMSLPHKSEKVVKPVEK